jgi:hypothetical protein
MPGTDPDPHRVVDDLRARLVDLRSLASQFPEERAYASAADHVASAIQALAPRVTAKKA